MSKTVAMWIGGIVIAIILGLVGTAFNMVLDGQSEMREEIMLIRSDIKDIERVVLTTPTQIEDIEEDIDELEEDFKEHKKEGHR